LSSRVGVLVAALAAALSASALAPTEALATAVRAAEVRELAGAARSSPRALAELRRVDRVDGRPADVGAALEGARGAALRRRLDVLAAPSVPDPGVDAASARADAREILSERRFTATEEPRPLAGPIETLGLAVERLLEWIADLLPGLEGDPPPAEGPAPGGGDGLSSGASIVLLLISLPIVALAAVVVVRLVRRRGAAPGEVPAATGGSARADGGDPSALERSADEAEGRGELARALRLRFGAGLLRLEEARAIELRPSLTTGEVVRRLRSSTLGELALSFEEVVYGGRAAEQGDVAAARAGWPRVLREVGGA
jgi:hypothetical protein